MKILITGGAGFIGSNLVRRVIETTQHSVVILDALTYAGNLANLAGCLDEGRSVFIKGSINDAELVQRILHEHAIDAVMHLAAESHVDRSILSAAPFIETNVTGTLVLLEAWRARSRGRFLHVSTDEVYGDLGVDDEPFTEESPLCPSSPYAASKAASDLLVGSFVRTYDMDCVITRCTNNYGPYQFPEKIIPLMTLNAIEGRSLPVYGDGLQSRDWIHVKDHCDGLLRALEHGTSGHVYNFGGGREEANIDLVQRIVAYLGADESLITHVKDRPVHERRYAIDSTLAMKELGWRPTIDFRNGLFATIDWYRDNSQWCNDVRSGEYRRFYEQQYQAEL